MADLEPAERRAIAADCLTLFNTYLVNADHHLDRFTDVFTEDVVWVRPGGEMHGHGEMRSFMDAIMQDRLEGNPQGHVTRHMLTTHSVTVESATRAHGIFYALVYRGEEYAGQLPLPMQPPELVVEYRSSFTRTEQGWLIERHEAKHIFSRHA